MFRTLLLLILLAITPLTTNAEERHGYPQCGYINYFESQINDQIGNGQCTLIDDDLAISATHVLQMAIDNPELYPHVWITFDGLDPIKAEIECYDVDNDVCILRLMEKVTDREPCKIAEKTPPMGSRGSSSAAGHRDIDIIEFEFEHKYWGIIYHNDPSFEGESGSAFFDENGEIVGSLTGGWGFSLDENGKIVCRETWGGWVTRQVKDSFSASTPEEIWHMIREHGLDNEIKKTSSSPKTIQENVLYVITMNGCPPCQYLKRQLKSWGKELEDMDVKVVIINKDKDPEFTKQFDCKAFPTVVGVVGGKLKFKITGCPKKDQLFKKLREVLK